MKRKIFFALLFILVLPFVLESWTVYRQYVHDLYYNHYWAQKLYGE